MHDDGARGLVPTAAEVLVHHHLGHHAVHLDAVRTGNQPQRKCEQLMAGGADVLLHGLSASPFSDPRISITQHANDRRSVL